MTVAAAVAAAVAVVAAAAVAEIVLDSTNIFMNILAYRVRGGRPQSSHKIPYTYNGEGYCPLAQPIMTPLFGRP